MNETRYQIFKYLEMNDEDIESLTIIGEQWDNATNQNIVDFKKNLNEKLEKNRFCPYCRRHLESFKLMRAVDHIIDKSTYSQFTYQPKNLVLACRRCNGFKLNKNVLCENMQEEVKAYEYNQYPFESGEYKIVHPFIDRYDEHIDIEEDFFFIPKDKKGEETIKLMKLDNFDLLEKRILPMRDSGEGMLGNALKNPQLDAVVKIWYDLLLSSDDFFYSFKEILSEFEKYRNTHNNINLLIVSEPSYQTLKDAIINNKDIAKYTFEYRIGFSASFIRKINNFGIDYIDEAIDQLEKLYKLRNYWSMFDYTLFLSLMFLIRKKNNICNKMHLEKYLSLA